MKKTRIVLNSDWIYDGDELEIYERFKDVDFKNITIMYCSFKEYMDSVHERNVFESGQDPYFGYDESFINDKIFEIHDYWEAGMSPYKALTFISI